MELVMLIPRICLTFILVILLHSNAYASAPVKIVSVMYPPLTFDNNVPGFGEGMLRDIVTESFNAVGLEAEYELLPMSRNVWSINNHVSEACIGAMQWFRESGDEADVDCIDLVNLSFVAFYKVKHFPDGMNFSNLDDLKEFRFGNVRGSSSQRTLDEAGLTTDLTRNITLNFLKLDADRFDFAVAFRVTGEYLITELFPQRVAEFAFVPKSLLKMPLSMIFRKEKRVLKKGFVEGLNEIVRNGTYYSILERYYGKGRVPEDVVPEPLRNLTGMVSRVK
ncbi:substrate-binding periplasmic protein [Maridesulfovibrio sp. FT414]|uniref:substrate-binding periplasmic protein n=1 Tax=Maridesulfovibrio sp. FT414 TaxID=2979469 RepID=UPI003D8037D1